MWEQNAWREIELDVFRLAGEERDVDLFFHLCRRGNLIFSRRAIDEKEAVRSRGADLHTIDLDVGLHSEPERHAASIKIDSPESAMQTWSRGTHFSIFYASGGAAPENADGQYCADFLTHMSPLRFSPSPAPPDGQTGAADR